ncbi:MAG: hypothetical protein V4604_09870 [Bacteroidota bacterium]
MKYIPRMTNLFVLTLVVLLISVSCKDKAPKPGGPCTTCQSVSAAKDFFYFKMGSWWVYEEETSHERDSMYVIEANDDVNGYDFDIRIKSALTDYEYHYWPIYFSGISGCSEVTPISKKCLFVKESKGNPGDFIGESNCFFIRHRKGEFVSAFNVNFPDNKVYIDDILDTFQLNSFSFPSTIKTHELAKIQDNNQPTNYYYAKGVGIVRKEFLDSNQVWNLVDYYIVP